MTADCTRSERDIAMPTGMPMRMAMAAQTRIIASVDIASSHIPNKPMANSATATPTHSFHERLASQVMPISASMTAHQGEPASRSSNHSRNCSKGSKKASMVSP